MELKNLTKQEKVAYMVRLIEVDYFGYGSIIEWLPRSQKYRIQIMGESLEYASKKKLALEFDELISSATPEKIEKIEKIFARAKPKQQKQIDIHQDYVFYSLMSNLRNIASLTLSYMQQTTPYGEAYIHQTLTSFRYFSGL